MSHDTLDITSTIRSTVMPRSPYPLVSEVSVALVTLVTLVWSVAVTPLSYRQGDRLRQAKPQSFSPPARPCRLLGSLLR